MPPSITGLTYGTVKWTVAGLVDDTADVGTNPDVTGVTGKVVITPDTDSNLLLATGSSPPVTVYGGPIELDIVDGIMQDDAGNSTITLLATDCAVINPINWTYKAAFVLNSRVRGSFSFSLPTGAAIDLTTVSPVPGSTGNAIIQGPQGIQGPVGPTGTGVPAGGATGQLIRHNGATTVWVDPTEFATPDTIVRRAPVAGPDAGGWAVFSIVAVQQAPTNIDHTTRKDYVDNKFRLNWNLQASDYTLAASDEAKVVYFDTNAATRTLTVPNNTTVPIPVGAWFEVAREGANPVNISAASGVIIGGQLGLSILNDLGRVRLLKLSTNNWSLVGFERAQTLADPVAGTAGVRTLGTGAQQAAAGNHSHTSITTAASETVQGQVELATAAETATGTDNTRAVHPAGAAATYVKQLLTLNTQVGTTYTFVLADGGNVLVEGNNASAITWTIPPNSSVAFPVGTTIYGRQIGAGQITPTAGAGVTLRVRGTATKSAGQWAEFMLTKRATDEWVLSGDLV